MQKTKVFISWSQERSHQLALHVRWWLNQVVQACDPWVSSSDIEAGSQPMSEISNRLADTSFGIICVTPENVERPWLNYEAGALSKQVADSPTKVVPLLFDFQDKADVHTPVGQFQAVLADKEGFEEIALALNRALPTELQRSDADVKDTHEAWWDAFNSKLQEIYQIDVKSAPPRRSNEDLLREIVNTVRELDEKLLILTRENKFMRELVTRNQRRELEFRSLGSVDEDRSDLTGLRRKVRQALSTVLPEDISPRNVSIYFQDSKIKLGLPRSLDPEEELDVLEALSTRFPQIDSFAFYNHGLRS